MKSLWSKDKKISYREIPITYFNSPILKTKNIKSLKRLLPFNVFRAVKVQEKRLKCGL